ENLNLLYIRKGSVLAESILKSAKKFYEHQRLPFITVIPKELCVKGMDNTLKNMGYIQTARSVCMFIKLSDHRQSNLESSSKCVIGVNDNLNDWMLPLVGAFESKIEITQQYTATHKNALKKSFKFYHFSLYKNENPISSITLSICDNLARIDDVGTLPEFQRKGYATRLLNHVLA